MNERIRELAKQCNFTDQDIVDMSPGFEKFADIIVRECLDIVKSNIYGPAGKYDYSYDDKKSAADDRAETIYNEMKYRFGVKE